MLFLASYFVGYLSEWILRTRMPIILFWRSVRVGAYVAWVVLTESALDAEFD